MRCEETDGNILELLHWTLLKETFMVSTSWGCRTVNTVVRIVWSSWWGWFFFFRSGCRNVSQHQQLFFLAYPHPDDHTIRTSNTTGFKPLIYCANTVLTENVIINRENIKNCSLLIGVDTKSPILYSHLISRHELRYVYFSQFTRTSKVMLTARYQLVGPVGSTTPVECSPT